MEKVSVIVPVYNVEKYIDRCVQSLFDQVYENIEIVLINDGSTDRSGEMCDEYAKKDSRVKVLHQEYNGVADARNKGVAMATGEYIIFLDGDDEADKEYVSKLYTTLKENDLDIAQCCLLRIRNGEPINKLEVKEGVRIFNGMEMQMKTFDRDRYFCNVVCGKLFKKELFEGLSFPYGRINEDESMIYLLTFKSERVGIIDDYLYYYHYNGDSITEKKYNIHRLDAFYMLEEKFAFYKERGLDAFANKVANEYFSQMSIVFCHKKEEIADDYNAIKKKAREIYKKDRKAILNRAKLRIDRRVFCILSYISVGFVKLYGVLLKKIVQRRKR